MNFFTCFLEAMFHLKSSRTWRTAQFIKPLSKIPKFVTQC